MPKYLIALVIFVSGCASMYGLDKETYDARKNEYNNLCNARENYQSELADKFQLKGKCLWFYQYNDLINKGYAPEVIAQVMEKTSPYLDFNTHYAIDLLENDIKVQNAKIKRATKEQEIDKAREQKVAELDKQLVLISKQYNKSFCENYNFFKYMVSKNTPQNNCMVLIDEGTFVVIQQIDKGTLYGSYNKFFDRTIMIERNDADSSLVDGSPNQQGLFEVKGNFRYSNVLGVNKTITKLKRLE